MKKSNTHFRRTKPDLLVKGQFSAQKAGPLLNLREQWTEGDGDTKSEVET